MAKFAEIADEVGAKLMVDMAHYAGLVAAGLHDNPVPVADFVTTTTHKTLRGPRGGLILCKKKYAKDINRSVFPGIQGGPLMHVIAGKAICFGEALQPEFKTYAQADHRQRARRWPRRLQAGGLRWSAAAPTTTWSSSMSRRWASAARWPKQRSNGAASRSTRI